jgi:hypothetical protein
MKQYDKIYVPIDNGRVTVKGNTAVCKWKKGPSDGWQFWEPQSEVKEESNVIVLTQEELLDLMQESIEHSYPTLLREKAQALLTAKLKNT